jgi:hypothetical protein
MDLCDAYIPSMNARAAAAARRVSALGEGKEEGGIGVFLGLLVLLSSAALSRFFESRGRVDFGLCYALW